MQTHPYLPPPRHPAWAVPPVPRTWCSSPAPTPGRLPARTLPTACGSSCLPHPQRLLPSPPLPSAPPLEHPLRLLFLQLLLPQLWFATLPGIISPSPSRRPPFITSPSKAPQSAPTSPTGLFRKKSKPSIFFLIIDFLVFGGAVAAAVLLFSNLNHNRITTLMSELINLNKVSKKSFRPETKPHDRFLGPMVWPMQGLRSYP